jgi:hypothetical protein
MSAAFRSGKLFVLLSADYHRGVPDGFLEAAAMTILYRVALDPDLASPDSRLMARIGSRRTPAPLLNGMATLPASALAHAGVQVQAKGHDLVLSRAGRRVEVTNMGWTMKVNGRSSELSLPVIPGPDGLVVPLRAVAEALGLTVAVSGGTIEIR